MKLIRLYTYSVLLTLLTIPHAVFAAPETIMDIVGIFQGLVNLAVPFIFSLTILLFLYGILKFMFLHSDDPAKRKEGRDFMMWGLISLFVMVSFWAIVNLLTNTFFGVNVEERRDSITE